MDGVSNVKFQIRPGSARSAARRAGIFIRNRHSYERSSSDLYHFVGDRTLSAKVSNYTVLESLFIVYDFMTSFESIHRNRSD
jgi:hypothetical protein